MRTSLLLKYFYHKATLSTIVIVEKCKIFFLSFAQKLLDFLFYYKH